MYVGQLNCAAQARRVLLFLLCFLLLPSVDKCEEAPQYVLEIYSNGLHLSQKTLGHAFMIIKVKTDHGYKEEAFGFYSDPPAHGLQDVPRLIIGTQGALHHEFERNPERFAKIEQSVELPITYEQRKSIYAVVDEWNLHRYSLLDDNCIKFVDQVVDKVGIPRPAKWSYLTPSQYVSGLRDSYAREKARRESGTKAQAPQELPNLFDAPAGGEIVDLATTPLWLDVMRAVGIEIKDAGLESRFKSESKNAMDKIKNELGHSANGYLLQVQMYVDELGAPIIPGDQLLYPIGVGTEPIDALAEHLRTPQLRAPVPTNANNQSYYTWVKNRDGVIGGWNIPREFRRVLEQKASEEADRRERLGQWKEALPEGGIERVKRSQYWHEVAQTNAAILQDAATQREIQQLQAKFDQAEKQFNKAYEAFQKTVAEMAEVQKRNETLENIQVFLGLVKSGIEVGELVCKVDGKPPSTDATPQESVPLTLKYSRTEWTNLNGRYIRERVVIKGGVEDLERINEELSARWTKAGAHLPKADPIPNIKP